MQLEQAFNDYITKLEASNIVAAMQMLPWDAQMLGLARDFGSDFKIDIEVIPTREPYFYEATLTVEVEDVEDTKRLVTTGKSACMELAMASATIQLKALQDRNFMKSLVDTILCLN